MIASQYNRRDVVQLLIDNNADMWLQNEVSLRLGEQQRSQPIYVLQQMGYTALMLAAEAGHKDVLHTLIEKTRKNEKLPSKFIDMKNKVWMVWKLCIGFLVDWFYFCEPAV
jgi:ankyrin repeat protein